MKKINQLINIFQNPKNRKNIILLMLLIIGLLLNLIYNGQKLILKNKAVGTGDIKVTLDPSSITKNSIDSPFTVNIKLTNNSISAKQIRVAGADIDISLNVNNFFTVSNLLCSSSLPSKANGLITNNSIKLSCFIPGGQTPITIQPNSSVNLGSFDLAIKTNASTGAATFSFSRTNIPDANTSQDISDGGVTSIYNIIGGPTLTPTQTPILSPTITPGSPTLTPYPNSVSMTLNIKIKVQGMVTAPKTELNKLKVKVSLKNPSIISGVFGYSKTVDFTYLNSNIWQGSVAFTAPVNSNYSIYIKGIKQLQTKFNHALSVGTNNLDFTNVYQMSGDLPNQDGVIDSFDLSLVRNNLGKTDLSILKLADLNHDGIVDSQDFSLILETLAISNKDEL